MHSIIFYNDDLKLMKSLYNNVLIKLENVRLIGMATNKNELSFLCEDKSPDILLTSESCKNNLGFSPTLNIIKNQIIFCENPTKYKNSKNSLYISQESDYKSIVKNMSKFVKKAGKENLRKNFYNTLDDLNFDFKLIGTKYLLESIIYSYETKDKLLFENLEKNIYPHIAQKFKVSISKVKWSVIRSINNMNSHLDSKIYPEKLTAKSLISELMSKPL